MITLGLAWILCNNNNIDVIPFFILGIVEVTAYTFIFFSIFSPEVFK